MYTSTIHVDPQGHPETTHRHNKTLCPTSRILSHPADITIAQSGDHRVALLAVSCLCTLVSTSTVTGNAAVPGDARMLSDAETDYGTTRMLPTRKCWQRDDIALVLISVESSRVTVIRLTVII